MFCSFYSAGGLAFALVLWSLSQPSETKSRLDPNVKDWGDYSDLPPGMELGLGLDEDRQRGGKAGEFAPQLDFLSDFAGKKRLWVITAPSHNDHYLRMMEKQLEEADQRSLNCRLAERDTFIVTVIQNAMMEGRIQKTSMQGDATVESLDPDTVTKLLHYLELTQEQTFNMLLLKKNLRVSERFPYPVRVEAILEIVDQFPMRKLEKISRKGSKLRCPSAKKKVVLKRKKTKKRIILSPHRHSNVTSVAALQRRAALDRKAALKSKIRDILNGRSRFVIRKAPTARRNPGSTGSAAGGKQEEEKEKTHRPPHVSAGKEEVKNQRPDATLDEGPRKPVEESIHEEEEKSNEKKKGKGKKGKKGKKGRGKKSNKELSEKDKSALKDFLDHFKGKRRLMLMSTPSRDARLYVEQRAENEKQHCQLAVRKVTVATIVGRGGDATLTLQHHQLESEPAFGSLPSRQLSDSGLMALLRAELGLSSPDLFSMTVTDYDIKPHRVFEAPPSSTAMLEYMDSFPSRRAEKEEERKHPPPCGADKQQPDAENPLLRFMSRRRLLLLSAPAEDDYSLQQQLSALNGQQCHLGIRHFAMLKLIGVGDKASGTVELFPLNGRSQSQVEPLARHAVNNLRDQLKISKDYFSMLVVGKDGDVKAWFPSPMWSLDNVYDLVDSMELRLQEEKLQKQLGIHCPEEPRGGGGGEGERYRGYDEDGA
ncbi:coiled-coil domain-containing protein 80 [Dunckerocampus dactyliophorus]|uniref:coiled-coil domain-containing protein 80 n=1 Tax=Dunckerocampus dactyliophorus TaxID=161453 RepID=UPI002404CAD7|nr:coiled-coil domain-containing protein 80 [Dunckerocampus dactyliophorus]